MKRTSSKQGSPSVGLKAEREEKKRFAFASLTGRGPRPRPVGPGYIRHIRPDSSRRYTYLARCDRLLCGGPSFQQGFKFRHAVPLASARTIHSRGGPVLEENNENAFSRGAAIIYLASRSSPLGVNSRRAAPRRNQRGDVIYRPFS